MLVRIAGVCVLIVTSAGVAAAQQQSAATSQQTGARVVERTYPSGVLTPSRQLQTRSASDGRETVTERVAVTGIEGKPEVVLETTTETSREDPNSVRTRHDTFVVGPDGQRTLLETSRTEQINLGGGSTRSVQSTWTVDSDGHRGLTTRQIKEQRSGPQGTERSETMLRPGMDGLLQESERSEHSQRQVGANSLKQDVQQVRDLNGRWRSSETRAVEARDLGSGEQVEEETIRRRDASGNLTVTQRTITRRSRANGREDVIVETYGQNGEGFVPVDGRLTLSSRVRRSTTEAADGSRHTVEEMEGRSLASEAAPMRLMRRVDVVMRKIDTDRWVTERRLFELDVNGRMAQVSMEREESLGK